MNIYLGEPCWNRAYDMNMEHYLLGYYKGKRKRVIELTIQICLCDSLDKNHFYLKIFTTQRAFIIDAWKIMSKGFRVALNTRSIRVGVGSMCDLLGWQSQDAHKSSGSFSLKEQGWECWLGRMTWRGDQTNYTGKDGGTDGLEPDQFGA